MGDPQGLAAGFRNYWLSIHVLPWSFLFYGYLCLAKFIKYFQKNFKYFFMQVLFFFLFRQTVYIESFKPYHIQINIKISVIMDILVFRFYGYIKNIGKIFLRKILIKRKLIKIL